MVFQDAIRTETLEDRELKYLLQTAVDYYAEYGTTIERDVLVMKLEAASGDKSRPDPEAVLRLYDQAREPSEAVHQYLYAHARDWFQAKGMQNAVEQASNLLEEGRIADARDLMPSASVEIEAVGDNDYGMSVGHDVEDFIEALLRNYGDSSPAVPCGIPTLDEYMKGGLRAGELGVFLGPPNRGKSQALVFVARHAATQLEKNVVYYTLEMGWERINERIWSYLVNRPAGDELKEVVDEIREQAKKLKDGLLVKQYPSRGASVTTLKAHLSALERNHGWKPDLVVVDYADILAAARHFDRRMDELGTIYEDLRGMAQKLEVGSIRGPPYERTSPSVGHHPDPSIHEHEQGALNA